MKFYLHSLMYLPLLVRQGKKVRKHTLRLPPPEGERTGSVGVGQPFNLLVLGDSAAEGVGTDAQDKALLGQLVRKLSETLSTQQINYQLIANTGDTTADIIASLEQHITEERCLTNLDVVVISAGVNDVTTFTKVSAWEKQIQQLIDLLQGELHAKRIIFTAVPPMEHFPALPSPLNTWLGLRAEMLNTALKRICHQAERIDFLKLDLAFDPDYMAADGFHPSAETYSEWASAVVSRIANNTDDLSV